MSESFTTQTFKTINELSSKKLPPTAPEAERSVLGCLLLDKDSILKIVDFIKPDDFYHDHHRFIFEAILELFITSEPIDLVTVSTKLQSQKNSILLEGQSI